MVKAVLLDACSVGRDVTLDDITRGTGTADYFITADVFKELEAFEQRDSAKASRELERAENALVQIKRVAQNRSYKGISDYVEILEDNKLPHNTNIARILYEGFKQPTQIVFRKRQPWFREYFELLIANYRPVLDAVGLQLYLEEGASVRVERNSESR